MHILHMTHASRSRGMTTNGLNRPLIGPLPRRWISTAGTGVLLDVIRGFSTATAEGMGLVVALAE
jgi:hypothetical protein